MTAFGSPRRHFRSTDSTNDRARELAIAGAPSGTVVSADEQRAGRGRRGRAWIAPAGGALLYSAILRPLERDDALLPLAAPLAVCEAIEAVAFTAACRIKWPNDVWIGAEKVAGVLIEARIPEWAVIGVGVNVAFDPAELPADLRTPATSVGHGVTPDELRLELDRSLSRWVAAGREAVIDAFAERDALAGRDVSWEERGERHHGLAAGIDTAGNLIVELDAGTRVTLGAGEVSLLEV